MEVRLRKPEDDNAPPRPKGVFNEDQPVSTYSRMMLGILDEISKTLDEKDVQEAKRYEALMREVDVHLHKVQQLQGELVYKLDDLEKEGARKITSENYHTGFDSSQINKTQPGEKQKEKTTPVLLNPNYGMIHAMASNSTEGSAKSLGASDQEARASSAAKNFAQIQTSDYRASHGFISSHPEILQESETDGLLVEALNEAFKDSMNDEQVWRYIHQALLLQYCRLLGPDGVSMFFKRIATGHQARQVFETDVKETYQRLRELAKKNARERTEEGTSSEQIQIHSLEPGTSISILIPPPDSQDEETRQARMIFEGFAPEMRLALESGTLDEVNKLLGTMSVPGAEDLVVLLGDVSVLKPMLSSLAHILLCEGWLSKSRKRNHRRHNRRREAAVEGHGGSDSRGGDSGGEVGAGQVDYQYCYVG